MNDWTFDVNALIATHSSGLQVQFEGCPDDEGALDGKTNLIPSSIDPMDLPRLMREAGDGMMEAIKATPKQ